MIDHLLELPLGRINELQQIMVELQDRSEIVCFYRITDLEERTSARFQPVRLGVARPVLGTARDRDWAKRKRGMTVG